MKVNNSERTKFFESNVGVLQEDNISPMLFNLYISDLKSFLGIDEDTPKLITSHINCLMYAVDFILLSRFETGLQALFNRLSEYCRNWHMEVNTEKTKIMTFSGNVHTCKSFFQYNNRPIENVSKYKYFGIELSTSGSWNNALENLSNRGMKALFCLKVIYA